MKLDLHLEYTLAEGWLAPWVAGLREGRAVAAVCGSCGARHFPAAPALHRLRRQNGRLGHLARHAEIRFRTGDTEGFALVRFDGAARLAVVRLDAVPPGAAAGRLQAVPEGPPAVVLGPGDAP